MADDVSLAVIEKEVGQITPLAERDNVLSIMERTRAFLKEAKRVNDLCEEFIIEWIKRNGDLVVSDTVRYYVGATKTTKCIDVPKTIEALMNATGGDFGKLCETLSSNCIKYGAAKKILSEADYAAFFITSSTDSLEEGKPDKKLKRFDAALVK